MLLLRFLPMLLLLPALLFADSDKNFRVVPSLFKDGVTVDPIKDSPLKTGGAVMVSQKPTFPLKENALYLRHKKGPKEYHWVQGTVHPENFKKVHAFSLEKSYLKSNEVVFMRFYGTQNAKAFQDETDLYFDRDYIYSTRIPKLFFIKNGRWQQLKEVELPGMVKIKTDDKNLEISSFEHSLDKGIRFFSPVEPGPVPFIFSSPGYLPYVDITVVKPGAVSTIEPKLMKFDSSAVEYAKISVKSADVQATKSLEETEILYDKFMAELKAFVDRVDMSQFDKEYPPMKTSESLGIEPQNLAYKAYVNRYNAKKNEAREIWADSKLKGVREVNEAFRYKLDSLQALPLKGYMMPASFEPVYDTLRQYVPADSAKATGKASQNDTLNRSGAVSVESSSSAAASQEALYTLALKAVKLHFGVSGGRYDVTWTGAAPGVSVDTLYSWFFNRKEGFKVYIALENNKPVWIYNEDVVASRHQYRYSQVEFEADGKRYGGEGSFALPEKVFEQKEVQDWLNRKEIKPESSSSQADMPSSSSVSSSSEVYVEMPKHIDEKLPKIIRDKVHGTVAMIDSGAFRYKGNVVSMSPFAIMTEEMTQRMYEQVMSVRDSSSRIPDKSTFKDPQKPVHNVNWENARAVCKSLGGDLPTEAQWEFAARAGSNEGALWVLDSIPNPGDYAVYRENSYKKNRKDEAYGPQKVGSRKANAWGIHDMSGNVAEWTRDKYFMFSFWVEDSNPTGAMMGYSRIYKGGSWKDSEGHLNLTESDDEDPRYWSEAIGFRCVYPHEIIKE